MRKYGVQRFLNPPDDDDSGSVQFYMTPVGEKNLFKGIDSQMVFADCNRKIFLNFDLHSRVKKSKKAYLASIVRRRRKMIMLRDAVNVFAEKYLDALDELELTAKTDSDKIKK